MGEAQVQSVYCGQVSVGQASVRQVEVCLLFFQRRFELASKHTII